MSHAPVWMLLPEPHLADKRGNAYYLVPLDGNLDQVKLADMTVDRGHKPPMSVNYFQSGRRLLTEHLPTALLPGHDRPRKAVKPGAAEIPDYAGSGKGQVVSFRFREVIETLEPGQHQFEPVQIQWKDGPTEDRFWFNPVGRVFALDPDASEPPVQYFPLENNPVHPRKDRPPFIFDTRTHADEWAPVFQHGWMGGRHVFCDGEFGGYVFISDALNSALDAAGVSGYLTRGPFRVV